MSTHSCRRWTNLAGGLVALLVFVGWSAVAVAAARPYLVRLTICDVPITDANTAGLIHLYDEQQGYHLYHSGDCDGAAIYLILSPESFNGGGKPAHLPRLRNGRGVNIGESYAEVQRKLGARPVSNDYNSKNGERVVQYAADVHIRSGSRTYVTYTAKYTFRNDRLQEIWYSLFDAHGCGG